MPSIVPFLTPLVQHAPLPAEYVKLGRPAFGETRMSNRQYEKRARDNVRRKRLERIGVIDFETEPFDKDKLVNVKPFIGVIYTDDFDPIVVWNEHFPSFVQELLSALEALPDPYTFYAHNGGKFDYMFLIHKLRGFVSFKGRGIMTAKIGKHEIRDSYHIIPDRLANIKKDDFDYTKNLVHRRNKYRYEITRYCVNDCAYLLDIVKKFIAEFGLKLSIGQAAIGELRKSYKVARLGENQDAFLRDYFFGGRVECLGGRGHFVADPLRGSYRVYDVNSMYPHVMARYRHPIGNAFDVRTGSPGPNTIFIELECNNFGAMVRRGEDGEISADFSSGIFRTTIWEYETALRHGLIENVSVNRCIDFAERTDFSQFVEPLYSRRQETKKLLKQMTGDGRKGSPLYWDTFKDDMFLKFILNNAYGKFAQNPRRFKECYITEPDEIPALEACSQQVKHSAWDDSDAEVNAAIRREWGFLPATEHQDYWIWERPQARLRFNNVATAASITGAARAILLDAIATADDPIYCDTDSVICRSLRGVELHNENLGAWKLEHEIDEALIAGKKLYAVKVAGVPDGHRDRIKIKSKGVNGLSWRDLERLMDDELITVLNNAPTLARDGHHLGHERGRYMARRVRATAGCSVSNLAARKMGVG